ncbi:MAG: BMP family ABC transporter substrate-binding protein, partial [Clostridia bacterium]|nr:BMP family ABC transporter substrate-binding protein [Clostridia bacterium]
MFKKVLSMLLVVAMLVGATFAFSACGDKKDDGVKAALICLHGDSSTYDKNFIDAFKVACANKGLSEDDYTIITDIPEGTECYDKAVDFAEAGYDVIFADSFGHEAYMIQAAKEYPDVQFCHATGTKAHTEGLSNYQNAFASI